MPTEKKTIPDISSVSIFARRYIEAAVLKNVFDEISNKFGIKAAEEIIGKACSTRKGHSQNAVHSNLTVTLLSPSGAL